MRGRPLKSFLIGQSRRAGGWKSRKIATNAVFCK